MLGRRKKKEVVERSTPRHEAKFSVRSRDLPGYKGISHDLSRTGIQLETEKALEVGKCLELELEFDRSELSNFSIPAKVVWSRQEEGSRARWLNGMVFLPQHDEHHRALARVSTVLQAREEADLRQLLDEANKIDPERAGFYEQTYGIPMNTGRVSSPTPVQQPPRQTPPQAPSEPRAPKSPPPHPGVFIPIKVRIEGYVWSREKQYLELFFTDGSEIHRLEFPRCRMITDYNSSLGTLAVGLFSTVNSEVVRRLHHLGENEPWRHYRFLDEQGSPVIEIISLPFRP